LVEVADKGSIFLDEIREMNLALQAKLLTSLDTQTFRRVGAVKPIRVDVRFIASTARAGENDPQQERRSR
jgi:two-component system, NtrC family, response regulator AtoC